VCVSVLLTVSLCLFWSHSVALGHSRDISFCVGLVS
jgi:hypothetical protein